MKLERVTLIPLIAEEKYGKHCCALHFLVLSRDQKRKRRLFRVLLTSAASLQQPCMHTHTRARTHKRKKTVRDSEGTSWFRVRPGRRAHKAMGTAGHRREDERSSAEMWRAEG